ncbi:hypothetical protein M0813_23096 [Anaeramoeba flamelloides]|uniref:BTB domain-containing protein n=1 Tax=Anaeramoeba flamelloides TaxID=1746091 RepID=A0ABQ8YBJ9_9EUKA|nr:hypothetical protein M0813_23096 [Anaeramoeba flamelloides]
MYCCGRNTLKQLPISETKSKISEIQPVEYFKEKSITIKQVAGSKNATIFLSSDDKLYITGSVVKQFHTIKLDFKPKKISAGYNQCLILSQDGVPYSFTWENSSCLGYTKKEFCVPKKIGKVIDDLKTPSYDPDVVQQIDTPIIDKILGCYLTSNFVSRDLNYYLCGRNSFRQNRETAPVPVLVHRNVIRVFGGVDSENVTFETKDHKFYGIGNKRGILENCEAKDKIYEIKFLNQKKVLSLKCGVSHALALIEENNKTVLYTIGKQKRCGLDRTLVNWEELNFWDNRDLVPTKIRVGCGQSFLILSDNTIYGWGYSLDGQVPKNTANEVLPQKVTVPIQYRHNFEIQCGTATSFFFLKAKNHFGADFYNLLTKKILTDDIISTHPCHRSFIEHRFGLQFAQCKTILETNFSKQDIETCLKWCYGSRIRVDQKLEGMVSSLFNGLILSKKPFKKDILALWADDKSKDFSLLVQEDSGYEKNQQEQEEEEEEEEEEFFEEIPVHKLVLIARSGLFREMFTNISENTNKVKDYSGKTIESLEILIKYFYTDKIELTADDDPELIIEELSDAVEYYQLNANSNLNHELKTIKNNFNLN